MGNRYSTRPSLWMGFLPSEGQLAAAADWTIFSRSSEWRDSLNPRRGRRKRKPPRTPEELQAERLRQHEVFEGMRRKLDAAAARGRVAEDVAGVTDGG